MGVQISGSISVTFCDVIAKISFCYMLICFMSRKESRTASVSAVLDICGRTVGDVVSDGLNQHVCGNIHFLLAKYIFPSCFV